MTFLPFLKKEWTELFRSGKLLLLLVIFTIFGILNSALAKLTPWLYETLSRSMAEQGITVTAMEVTALTSWNQFYKNISLAIIVFAVMICGSLAEEYRRQTLIPLMARGLSLPAAAGAKMTAASICWTACYWLCYLVTWAYSLWFWDNAGILHPLAAGACIWLFGLWVLAMLFLGSVLLASVPGSLLTAAAAFLAGWMAELFQETAPWSPARLLSAGSLVSGAAGPEDFGRAAVCAVLTGALATAAAVWGAGKRPIS